MLHIKSATFPIQNTYKGGGGGGGSRHFNFLCTYCTKWLTYMTCVCGGCGVQWRWWWVDDHTAAYIIKMILNLPIGRNLQFIFQCRMFAFLSLHRKYPITNTICFVQKSCMVWNNIANSPYCTVA